MQPCLAILRIELKRGTFELCIRADDLFIGSGGRLGVAQEGALG